MIDFNRKMQTIDHCLNYSDKNNYCDYTFILVHYYAFAVQESLLLVLEKYIKNNYLKIKLNHTSSVQNIFQMIKKISFNIATNVPI